MYGNKGHHVDLYDYVLPDVLLLCGGLIEVIDTLSLEATVSLECLIHHRLGEHVPSLICSA